MDWVKMKVIVAVMNNILAAVNIGPEKSSDLYEIWTHDPCDTSAVLYQLR